MVPGDRNDPGATGATSLDRISVGDVMRHGTLTCQAETPLRTVAGMMAEHRVHSVVVTDLDGVSERPWGIVTSSDLLRAAGGDMTALTAGVTAATELLTVPRSFTVEEAARLMAEHDVDHVVVVQGDKPTGVLSSLDVARVLYET